jgi:cytochrome c
MSNHHGLRILAILLALAASLAAARGEDDRESAFRGKRLAEANCSGCHAIAQFDESPLRMAPPLRDIAGSNSASVLREKLRGAVFLEHAVMPDFEPSDEQADDLANHMLSIAESAGKADAGPSRRLH